MSKKKMGKYTKLVDFNNLSIEDFQEMKHAYYKKEKADVSINQLINLACERLQQILMEGKKDE